MCPRSSTKSRVCSPALPSGRVLVHDHITVWDSSIPRSYTCTCTHLYTCIMYMGKCNHRKLHVYVYTYIWVDVTLCNYVQLNGGYVCRWVSAMYDRTATPNLNTHTRVCTCVHTTKFSVMAIHVTYAHTIASDNTNIVGVYFNVHVHSLDTSPSQCVCT